nr:zinc finger, CCHC-type [Tanacetum cinerariifolium]
MKEPEEQHMKAIKKVLRYVKGIKDYGITYKHNGGNKIHGYSDSSYGVNTQEGKRTTGIIFYYGESQISWSTEKQATVALSSYESEFITATAAATQALWLKRLLSRITHSDEEKITILVDNKSAIALMKNPVFHGRSKHIDTKYHFIRECVERDDIQVEFVSGDYQKADILTKALPKIRFLTMRQLVGLKDLQDFGIFDFALSEFTIQLENRVLWSDKLEDALWEFRTAFKTPVCCITYRITPERLKFSCVGIFVRFPRSSYPLIDSSLGKFISFDLYCLAVIFPPLSFNCKH